MTESKTIRIGGIQEVTYVAGISGVTTVNAAVPVLIAADGQLGTISSSRRYKEQIQDLGEASQAVLGLRPVSFRYRGGGDGGALQFGLIAEEVAETFPELVYAGLTGAPESVRYHLLPVLLLNELQRLRRQVADQEARLAAQEAALRALQAPR